MNGRLDKGSSHDEARLFFSVSPLPDLNISATLRKAVVNGKPGFGMELESVPNGISVVHRVEYPVSVADCRQALLLFFVQLDISFVKEVLYPLCQYITEVTGQEITLDDLRALHCADPMADPLSFIESSVGNYSDDQLRDLYSRPTGA